MAATQKRKKSDRSVTDRMVSAIRSPFDRAVDAARVVLNMTLKLVSLEEFAKLLDAPEKCRKVAEFIRDLTLDITTPLPETGVLRTFPTWRTFRVGVRKNADEFRTALAAAGHRISPWAEDLLGKIVFPPDMIEEEVEFACVSNADLGLTSGATREETEKAALAFGLVECQPTDGPAIREAYRDQPDGECLLVMMDPLTGPRGYPSVFYLERGGGGSWLDAGGCHPRLCWNSGDVWVFRRK